LASSRDQGSGDRDQGSEPASPKLDRSHASEGGKYPALDVDGVDSDFLLALVDDFNPSAVDTDESVVTIFFADAARRDHARDAIVSAHPEARVHARDVDDEDWARRSQENLTPITVGRITVTPPWFAGSESRARSQNVTPAALTLVIAPSMGFGTGHHATTRLCLGALQELDLIGTRVVDVGTGSGVLAIAARLLGAGEVIGIDDDPDAIQSAIENLARNPAVDHVRFDVKDLRAAPLPRTDVITANLTGALLIRSADLLLQALNARGSLIVSGLQSHERDAVVRAFGDAHIAWEATEEEWVGLIVRSG
jgi:ribosomal protein L11 methyltransferase